MPYITSEEQSLWSKGYAFVQRWFPNCVWFQLKVPDEYLDLSSDDWPQYAVIKTLDTNNSPCEVCCIPSLVFARHTTLVESGMSSSDAEIQVKVEHELAYKQSVEALAYMFNDVGMLPYTWTADPFRGETSRG